MNEQSETSIRVASQAEFCSWAEPIANGKSLRDKLFRFTHAAWQPRVLFDLHRPEEYARKVFGIGSVATRYNIAIPIEERYAEFCDCTLARAMGKFAIAYADREALVKEDL